MWANQVVEDPIYYLESCTFFVSYLELANDLRPFSRPAPYANGTLGGLRRISCGGGDVPSASPPSMVVSVTAIQAQESGTGAWLADVGRKLGG